MATISNDDLHEVYPEESDDPSATARLYTIPLGITLAFCMITGIVSIFGLIKYWKKSNFPFIQKRHPILVMITVICLICSLLIERPLSFLARLSLTSSRELQWTRWVLHVILVPVQSACIFLRIYMTRFDIAFFKRNAKSAWAHYIDVHHKLDAKSQRAVTDHKSKGNIYKVYPRLLTFVIFVIFTLIIASLFEIDIAVFLNAVILILFTALMIVMWFRTPRFLDAFKITSEIRRVLQLQLAIAIINITYFILHTAMSHDVHYTVWLIPYCLAIVAVALLAMVQTWWVLHQMSLLHKEQYYRQTGTKLTTAKSNSDEEEEEEDELVLEVDIMDVINTSIGFEAFMSHLAKEFSMENLLAVVEMNQYKARFRYIRDVQDKLEAGLDPLEKQHSMKITNIVFKVMASLGTAHSEDIAGSESGSDLSTDNEQDPDLQVNKATTNDDIAGDVEMQTSTADDKSGGGLASNVSPKSVTELRRMRTAIDVNQQVLPLPEGLPFSTIVYGERYNETDLRADVQRIRKLDLKKHAIKMVRALYEKYIKVGSELELNLSHRLRSRCLEKLLYLDEMDEVELEHMFDKCVAAVIKLMQDSYGRFKETHEFKKYEAQTKKKKKQNSTVRSTDLGGIFGDLM